MIKKEQKNITINDDLSLINYLITNGKFGEVLEVTDVEIIAFLIDGKYIHQDFIEKLSNKIKHEMYIHIDYEKKHRMFIFKRLGK